MSTKHTPGPWGWHGIAIKGDPYERTRYEIVTTGKTIARVVYSSYEGGPTNSEADARLIAAAPDLLDALELTAYCLRWWHERMGRESKADENALNAARAAIQKATAGENE